MWELLFDNTIKLNYRCEKGTIEADSFSCGKTPEDRKKNYDKQQKGKKLTNDTSSNITKSESLVSLQSKLKSLQKDAKQGIHTIHKSDGTKIDVKSAISQIQTQIENLGKNTNTQMKSISNQPITNETKLTSNASENLSQTKISNTNKGIKWSGFDKKNISSGHKALFDLSHKVLEKLPVSKKDTPIGSINPVERYVSGSTNMNTSLWKYPKISDKKFENQEEYDKARIKNYITRKEAITKGDIDLFTNQFKNIPRIAYTEHNASVEMNKLISESTIKEPVTLYCGITKSLFQKLPKESGKSWKNKSIMSTSVSADVATDYANLYDRKEGGDTSYIMEIRLKPGDKALSIEEYTKTSPYVGYKDWTISDKNDREVVIGKDTSYKIVEIKTVGQSKHIVVESI